MAKIEHVSMFRTGDGREHRDLDLAVAHERFALVQNLLVEQRLILHIDLTEIDRIAQIICDTQPAVQEFFAEDMKRGLHRGGIVSLRGDEIPRIMEQSTIPHPRDVLGEVIQVGDTVDIYRASADSFSLNVWGGGPRRIHEITATGKIVAEGISGTWSGTSLLKIKTTPGVGGAGGNGRPETIIVGSGGSSL